VETVGAEKEEVEGVEEGKEEEAGVEVAAGQKTEVYENFELELIKPEVKRKPYTPIDFSQPEEFNACTFPSAPFSFLSELKSTLNQRTSPSEIVYKEFDTATGAFRVITKAERDQKQRDLEEKLRVRAEKQRQERLREEEDRRNMLRGVGGGMGMSSLFAKLRQRRQEVKEGDEVFE
jgi:hypothetical protein